MSIHQNIEKIFITFKNILVPNIFAFLFYIFIIFIMQDYFVKISEVISITFDFKLPGAIYIFIGSILFSFTYYLTFNLLYKFNKNYLFLFIFIQIVFSMFIYFIINFAMIFILISYVLNILVFIIILNKMIMKRGKI